MVRSLGHVRGRCRGRLAFTLLVAVSALLLAGAGPAQRGTRQQPRQPSRTAATADTAAFTAAARRAIESDGLAAFAATFDKDLGNALSDVKNVDAERVVRLAAFREFGRYFGAVRLPSTDQKATLDWLAGQPRLLVPLALAVSDADDPARVLGVLAALKKEFGDAIVETPDLTTAFCVVWDDPPQPAAALDDGEGHIIKMLPPGAEKGADAPSLRPLRPAQQQQGGRGRGRLNGNSTSAEGVDADTQRLLTLYRYYTEGRRQLQTDPTVLSWQLAVYVVDNPVSREELQWAFSRYKSKGFTGHVYYDVNYDLNAYYTGQSQKRGNRPYTLANLQRYGGVCKDQAYFASSVAKSLGIPAAVCTGSGGTGRGAHAWIGFLQTKGNNPAWNFNEGRYEEHLYWSGAVVDPQTGAILSDADVELLAELLDATPMNRLASMALWKSRDLVEPARHADLYAAAINLSAGNRNAWLGLAELGATGKLSDAQADEVSRVVNKFAVKEYPDFAFEVCRKMAAGRPAGERLTVLKKMEALFPRRPDLVATLRVERGDLLREQGRKDEALQVYLDVVGRDQNIAPVMLNAMQRVDQMLRESNQLERLADVYEQTWTKLPTPDPGAFANTAPYYKIGQRYADLLDLMGRRDAAADIRDRLAKILGGAEDVQ